MKSIKFLFAALIAGFAFTACNSGEPKDNASDTIIIDDDSPEPAATETTTQEDEGSSIGFDVNTDEDGNVSGGVEGDIDLDKK
ncbi:MAG TPA: hypothetical protein DDW81_10470 [Cryomorphaceae bacterium]|nr:hypothetical protein [Owenweeksia sp.]HBF20513.1 hypothetical protein [Cryomorphaceae bacterium]|tara:strand:+ start:313 stop:561 length:249 start_codon:yes stop_codon:yes gene_type:complete